MIDKVLLDRIQRIIINPLNKVDKIMVSKKPYGIDTINVYFLKYLALFFYR